MVAKVFLTIVGVAYAGLAIWCSLFPKQTSAIVGFDLKPGSGQSEFLTVYGGLEMGLAILFLWPLLRPEHTAFALFACLAVHACLVVFRTIGFFAYPGIASGTYQLAAVEWLIFLVAAYCYFWEK